MSLIECKVRIVFPGTHRVGENPLSLRDHYLTGRVIENSKKSNRSWIDESDIQHSSIFLVEYYQRGRIGAFPSKVIVRIDEEFISPNLRDNPTIPAEHSRINGDFPVCTLEREHFFASDSYDHVWRGRGIRGGPPKENGQGSAGNFSTRVRRHRLCGWEQKAVILRFLRLGISNHNNCYDP